MRASSFKNFFCIWIKLSLLLPSNLRTNLGVVLDALNKPHPFLKFILRPSRVIFSPSRSQFFIKSSIILNLFSSVTFIFNSGVANRLGSLLTYVEILSLFLEISSIILTPE